MSLRPSIVALAMAVFFFGSGPAVIGQDTWRIDVGGEGVAADDVHEAWHRDAFYFGGRSFSQLGESGQTVSSSERVGDFVYRLPVARGAYHVTLLFASAAPWDGMKETGELAFDVRVQGQSVRARVDHRLLTRGEEGHPLIVPAEVDAQGELVVALRSGRREARLAGLRVTPMRQLPRLPELDGFGPKTQESAPIRINAGGGEYRGKKGYLWAADKGFLGGEVYSAPDAIADTGDDVLYRSERFGNFTYGIEVENGTYEVRLHFAEIFFGVPSGAPGGEGSRVFDVILEGKTVFDDLDLIATAGPATALAQSFEVDVDDGQLDLELLSVVNSAKLSALEILPIDSKHLRRELTVLRPLEAFPPTEVGTVSGAMDFEVRNTGLTPIKLQLGLVGPHTGDFELDPEIAVRWLVPGESLEQSVRFAPSTEGRRFAKLLLNGVSTVVLALEGEGRGSFDRPLRINVGGGSFIDDQGQTWVEDAGFLGGETNSYPGAIAETENDALYQDERFGDFLYHFDAPNGRYRVRLHFAEIYWGVPGGGPGGAGQRLFNVWAEEELEISSLDLWATYGPATAGIQEFEVVVSDGGIDLRFESLADFATLSAIELERILSFR
ncbi:MAG: malectin domain-containing carbohydrate-binding protein [Planctomycetota bacterium]